jgi:hypothetical protein
MIAAWAAIEPTVLRWGFYQLLLFLVAKDSSIYYLPFTDSVHSTLVRLGGYVTSRPTAVTWGSSILLFFGEATAHCGGRRSWFLPRDGHLVHHLQMG